jgi:hypothetical protein
LDSPHPLLLKVFFWYVVIVSLITCGLQLFAPSVYVDRELRYTAGPKARKRWRILGILLFIGTPFYVWLYFYFSRAGWVTLSVAMTYLGAAECVLRGRARERRTLHYQSLIFAALNFCIALAALYYLFRR